jgi:DNA-binding IclR family transcriptional regulator
MLGKIVRVLDAVAARGPIVSRTYIARSTGLPKATANRIVAELIDARLLQPVDGGVALGIRLFELGSLAEQRGLGLRDASLPYMEDLYEITHETVQLAVLDGMDVIYLQKLSGRRSVRLDTRVGGRRPLTCTGSGKLLLAFSTPEFVNRVIEERGFVERTPNSIRDVAKLRRALARIRTERYAVDDEEFAVGTRSIAAPVVHGGMVVAALTVSGRASRTHVPAVAPAIRAAAAAISRQLAHVPSPVYGGAAQSG